MKKGFLIAAIVLFIGAAAAVAMSVYSFTEYSDMMAVADEQTAKSEAAEKVGNDDQAIRFLEYATDNAQFANENRNEGYMLVGGALILAVAGGVLLRKSKEV